MSIYGVPILISYDYYLEFLSKLGSYPTYDVFITSPLVIPLYIFVNFLYLWFMFRVIIPFIYKVIIWFNNCFLEF